MQPELGSNFAKDLFVGVEQVVRPAICRVGIRGVVWQQVICPCPRVQGLADCLSHILKLYVYQPILSKKAFLMDGKHSPVARS